MSRPNNNIVAIVLSKSLGPVMMLECERVGRSNSKVSKYQVLRNSDNRSNLSATHEIFKSPCELAINPASTFNGKDVVVGIGDESFVIKGEIYPAAGFFPSGIKFENVNRRTDTLIVDDIEAILFVDVSKQEAQGIGQIRGEFYGLGEGVARSNAKEGFADTRQMLKSALDQLEKAERDYDSLGFSTDENNFSFELNSEQDHYLLYIKGKTAKIPGNQVGNRVAASIYANRTRGFTLKSSLEKKAQLESELAQVQKIIDGK